MKTWSSFAALMLVVAVSSDAQAVTKVWVQNNTPLKLKVRSTNSGDRLSGRAWGQKTRVIPPGKRALVIWFNRSSGIKKGKQYQFTTSLRFGRKWKLTLRQRLKGKSGGSAMWAAVDEEGWTKSRKEKQYSWRVAVMNVTVRYRVVKNDGDDDVEYVLQGRYDTPKPERHALHVLAYNVWLRPEPPYRHEGQKDRGTHLGDQICDNYDAIAITGAFHRAGRQRLVRGLKRCGFRYYSKVLRNRGDRNGTINGGVFVVSRHRAKFERRFFGRALCDCGDCRLNRGVIHARIRKRRRVYHVFAFEAQPQRPDRCKFVVNTTLTRRRQFQFVRRWIDELTSRGKIKSNEPVILAGSMNVKARSRAEYHSMLSALHAQATKRVGPVKATIDPRSNPFATGKKPRYLDFVLYSKNHLQPAESISSVRLFFAEKRFTPVPGRPARFDLSERYGVFGRLVYARRVKRSRCGRSKDLVGGKCVAKCGRGSFRTFAGKCSKITQCKGKLVWAKGKCHKPCKPGAYRNLAGKCRFRSKVCPTGYRRMRGLCRRPCTRPLYTRSGEGFCVARPGRRARHARN